MFKAFAHAHMANIGTRRRKASHQTPGFVKMPNGPGIDAWQLIFENSTKRSLESDQVVSTGYSQRDMFLPQGAPRIET
jgi:hypothetical protein